MKIAYIEKRFGVDSKILIDEANEIIEEYQQQGFQLTLRQLYYQFVARDMLKNETKSYKRLGSIINDGRLAGLIDWDAIEDRTRNLSTVSSWDSPQEMIEAAASQFRLDLWADQKYRPEIWIEKEALAGVFERVCARLRVPYIACRGYMSQSEMWATAERFKGYREADQFPVILHFGDMDPSGCDMSRDIQNRLEIFGLEVSERTSDCDVDVIFRRLALNMDQVRQYDPPPNPAKVTDSRFEDFARLYGDQSWELDALDPKTLEALAEQGVKEFRDGVEWNTSLRKELSELKTLSALTENWDTVSADLSKK